MRKFEPITLEQFNKLFYFKDISLYEHRFICYAYEHEDSNVLRKDDEGIINDAYDWIDKNELKLPDDYGLFFYHRGFIICFKDKEIAMNFYLLFG